MAKNRESLNVGYESHVLYPYYSKNYFQIVDRCEKCGSENIYGRPESDGRDADLFCSECDHKTELDYESFSEWCTRKGFDADLSVIYIKENTDMDIILDIIRAMTPDSPRIILQGDNTEDEDIH